MSDRHIGETTLAAMVLHAARGTAPALAGVTLCYTPAAGDDPTWELAGITYGAVADHAAAQRAVTEAVAVYRLFWIMVPDGDPRNDQVTGPLTPSELSRLLGQTLPRS